VIANFVINIHFQENDMAATAIERIVVQATTEEKSFISAKARKLGIPVSELMRRGATAFKSADAEEELGALADAAKRAADHASDSIDDALAFITASNKRIEAMEAKAIQPAKRSATTSVRRSGKQNTKRTTQAAA
jgi:hypothetical protein